ncbi:MAG TPA: penicillin-binding transpeptidase domain-containing protein [Candidatus Cloacimonadota bacterium]|nr:penicillin-binding transpeptidase domain-containing protein [Candidatus Cloacimonadota bacterium]HPS38869.1 penicillin-binding transpeptidase domain-containing protein [Candidatus Cloacimonadota bacterium]
MRSRYFLMVGLIGFACVVWAVYLFSIQVLDPFKLDKYRTQRYTPQKDILIPKRGAIYDCKGELLVSSVSYYQIDIDREAVGRWAGRTHVTLDKAYDMIANAISKNSSITKEQVMSRLTKGKRLTSIQISNKIRESDLDSIIKEFETKQLPGLIHNFSSMKRIYSKDKLAGRVLGAVTEKSNGYDEETSSRSLYQLAGVCGIEATYDNILAGSYGWREVVLDANSERVPYPNLHQKKPQQGNNLKLTIDSNIQEIVETALTEGVEKYSASNAGCVVMDPHTGRILAMAGISKEDKESDPNIIRNKTNIPASFMFEPGSTMKPLTLLPALENKVIGFNETIMCGTQRMPNGRIIADTHIGGLKPLAPRDILAKSSNTGIATIATRLGPTKLYEQFISYGFGQKTGLNLFGESSGLFSKLDNWDSYTIQSISFGQGISVTAIQLASAYCAIANGGKYMKPYLVDSILDDEGQVIEQFEPKVLREIGSKAITDTIKVYIKGVVDHGTARNVKMDYINIGGKTGTAEKNTIGTKGYVGGKYTAVFMGMFPIEAPQMVIVTFYDEPAPGYHYGSTSAAPTTKQIIEDILFMPGCSILPFNERLRQYSLTMPTLTGKHLFQAEQILNAHGFIYKIEGPDSASVVVDQFPKPGVSVDRSHPITVKIGKSSHQHHEVVSKGTMPDLVGMTIRRAMQVSAKQKITLKIKGSGIVRSQSVQPGSRIMTNSSCVLEASI